MIRYKFIDLEHPLAEQTFYEVSSISGRYGGSTECTSLLGVRGQRSKEGVKVQGKTVVFCVRRRFF